VLQSKRCSKCKEVLPISQFHANRAQPNGYQSSCKNCLKVNNPRSTKPKKCSRCKQIKDADEFATSKNSPTGLQGNCRSCCDEVRLPLSPETSRQYVLKNRYGMTLSDYDDILKKQKGRCAICQKQTKLVVDHCHTHNHVRGLLCNGCNRGIGFLGEDVTRFKNAIVYLQRNALPLDKR
jgi:hypothetical protein